LFSVFNSFGPVLFILLYAALTLNLFEARILNRHMHLTTVGDNSPTHVATIKSLATVRAV